MTDIVARLRTACGGLDEAEELALLREAADEIERLRASSFPNELTPALQDALGLLNFRTGPIAHLYRLAGHAVKKRCEDEQAFVLHRCVIHALKHGNCWREHAEAEFSAIKAALKAKAATSA